MLYKVLAARQLDNLRKSPTKVFMAIPRATDQIYNDEVNSLNLVRSLFLANLLVLDLTEMWRSITLQRPNEARETEKVKDEN